MIHADNRLTNGESPDSSPRHRRISPVFGTVSIASTIERISLRGSIERIFSNLSTSGRSQQKALPIYTTRATFLPPVEETAAVLPRLPSTTGEPGSGMGLQGSGSGSRQIGGDGF